MSAHQQSLNQHLHSQQLQQAVTSSSSRLGVPGSGDSAVLGYQQQVPAVDGAAPYQRAMCAAAYNGEATPTAAHQGPTSLPAVGGYTPAPFAGSRGHNASVTPGHTALGGPTAHAAAAASYCTPIG